MFKNFCLIGMLFISFNLYAQCTKDTDCKGNRICENGVCVYPASFKNISDDKNEKKAFSKKTKKEIKKKNNKIKRYKLKGKQLMTLTILTGILSDVLVGVGLIVYYKTDQTRSSYVFFGIGGALFLSSMATLGGSVDYYKKAGELEKEVEQIKKLAYKNKYITVYIPTPVIYKNGKQDLYGVSFNFQF